jgi:hypothetical protein
MWDEGPRTSWDDYFFVGLMLFLIIFTMVVLSWEYIDQWFEFKW